MEQSKSYTISLTELSNECLKSVQIQKIASKIPIVKVQNTDHTSLGPFVRVTQDIKDHKYIYAMAFFNKKVKNFVIDCSGFETSKRITIIANDKTNIKKEKQNLLCFKFVMKHDFPYNEQVDIEIDFSQKKGAKEVGEPTRGTIATTPNSSIKV